MFPYGSPQPETKLVCERMEARGPDTLILRLVLHIINPGDKGAALHFGKNRLFLNGAELSGGFYFETPPENRVAARSSERIEAMCAIDLKNTVPALDAQDIEARAVMELAFAFDGGKKAAGRAETSLAFPRIREPEFSIVSIAVMQAELINTRFKVKVKIRNPNPFPVTLSSFSYELYGSGRLWAGGRRKNIYIISENGEAEESLFMVMNFIDMRRELLDQIIAMSDIRYRFTGEAEIATGIEYLPSFTANFDLKGTSEVLR